MHIPTSDRLPVNLLAACFNNTAATYKYYWLLSILEEVEHGNMVIPKKSLFARMISNAWYTVNYFHVSFGSQDQIQNTTRALKEIEGITMDERRAVVYQKLCDSRNPETESHLWHFNKNVPHWFLSPWFFGLGRAAIYDASRSFKQQCLYALHSDKIEVNPEWAQYLVTNARVLKDFCLWNLCLFLQAKNPNVPDIPNKLIRPVERNGLKKQRTQFWDIVVSSKGAVNCIYTDTKLEVGEFVLDHFIPFNFVSHDLIWNLIPIKPEFNSYKSDRLPRMEAHFDKFFLMHKEAIDIVKAKTPNNKLLEDYLTIFPDLDEGFTKERLRDTIQPLITIASNNGFEILK